MNAKIIKFPMHRVRRDPFVELHRIGCDQFDQVTKLYRDAFVANLNALRAIYGLAPL